MTSRDLTQFELDVRYWETELLAAVARHDAAMEALFLAADEVQDIKGRLGSARAHLTMSRKLPPPERVRLNLGWLKEAAS